MLFLDPAIVHCLRARRDGGLTGTIVAVVECFQEFGIPFVQLGARAPGQPPGTRVLRPDIRTIARRITLTDVNVGVLMIRFGQSLLAECHILLVEGDIESGTRRGLRFRNGEVFRDPWPHLGLCPARSENNRCENRNTEFPHLPLVLEVRPKQTSPA